jgi:hypothetical protein
MTIFLIIAGCLAAFFVALFFLSRPSSSGAISVTEEFAVHNTKAKEYAKVLGGGCGCGPKKTKTP